MEYPPARSFAHRLESTATRCASTSPTHRAGLLSVQGAEHNRFVPHAKIEKWLRGSGLEWTFIRPSFFMQNLTTTHVTDIRDRSELVLPAGNGRTAFVDVADVAAVVAEVLRHPSSHRRRAWTPTGSSADTYAEVVRVLSDELGRKIRYTSTGLLGWARHTRRVLGMPWPMVLVTTVIYLTARFGLAAGLTDDVRTVLGRDPTPLRDFAHRERSAWTHPR